MNVFHTDLTKDKWASFTLAEQMANIGSEVIRAINWRKKGNSEYSRQAFYRALELFDLSLSLKMPIQRLREISRLRSVLTDDFEGKNVFKSTDKAWQNYFMAFTYAAAIKR